MSSWQLGLDLIATFLLAAGLLFHYGNWYRHHLIVTLFVLIAWYFSFIIVFVLPIDISTTTYSNCLSTHNLTTANTTICPQPGSYVGESVLTNLWRVVYWSSQILTWILLPMMQSYTQAGEFTVKGKIKSALLDNAIYYGGYLFICSILLIYLTIQTSFNLDLQKLKAIASSASNSWGLFLLVFMLGYGLVAVPKTLYYSSCRGYSLNISYFKIAKLSQERNNAEEELDDVLETLGAVLKSCNNFGVYLSTIEGQIPTEFRERMNRRRSGSGSGGGEGVEVDERKLIKLHKQVKKTLQFYHRVEMQWKELIDKTLFLEDIEKSTKTNTFTHSFEVDTFLSRFPRFEKTYYCTLTPYLLKTLSLLSTLLSLSLIWSESTFFSSSPVLSIFAVFLNHAQNYTTIEAVSTITIAYMAVCAFYTIFKIRIFNFYYLAGGHSTDEYSLIFSGMLLSRITPPLCLNVISLFQMDSHVVNVDSETSYTKVMGHMDVLSLISDGFNIYFPMGILLIALLTWFKVGARVLSIVGFHQFIEEDDVTNEMVLEGVHLIGREKRKKERTNTTQRITATNHHLIPSSHQQRYYTSQPSPPPPPPRDLFNDV